MYSRNMPLSRASCILRATSHAADVETPMVTIGIDPTNQATDSIARSPMVLITTLYGLSSRKKFDAMSVLRLLFLRCYGCCCAVCCVLCGLRLRQTVCRQTIHRRPFVGGRLPVWADSRCDLRYRYSQLMNCCAVPVFLVPVAMPMSALWSLSAMLVHPAASESFNP